MTKKKKILLISLLSFIGIILLALLIPFTILGVKSNKINKDYEYLFEDNIITDAIITDVPLVKQEISCGYAIIDMLSSYYGSRVSENELYEKNNHSITTASTVGFVQEINNVIPNKKYTSYEYLNNDELLKIINQSLLNGAPVAVEWAAKLDGVWTLHWSIVVGMDHEHIYINNPYGYLEEITYEEFISRTTFKAFNNMPLGYYFGFAYGLFSKNTIIVAI